MVDYAESFYNELKSQGQSVEASGESPSDRGHEVLIR
jgi:hypothetical protein